jgi:hypothetical protein
MTRQRQSIRVLSLSLFFHIFLVFFTSVAPKLVLLTEYVDVFSHTVSRKKKRNRAEKYRKRSSIVVGSCRFSVISNFSCQFSLCTTKEKKKRRRMMPAIDG